MRRARPWLDVAAMATLTLLALAPLSAAYLHAGFWIAALAGVALGAAIATAAAVRRWAPLSIAAMTVVAYFVFGAVAVFRADALFGILPTVEVLAALAVGAVQVWKQVLTLPAPFTGFEQLALAPFIAALVVTVVAVSFALRLRRFALALIPIGALLVFSIAFSTYRGFAPVVVGAVFAAVAIGWASWRTHVRRVDAGDRGGLDGDQVRARRAGPTAAVAAGVLVVATALGGTAAFAVGGASRDVLRDHVVPPLELHDYASPLTSFRKWVTDGEDAELFTVTGLPEGGAVRLATLDLYDGIVYEVSGGGGAGSGVFARVGREIPQTTKGERAQVDIEIRDLTGVWVPTVGYLDAIAPGGGVDPEALHYNSATGTAVLTTGVTEGETFALEGTVPEVPGDEELARAGIARITTPAPERAPEELAAVLETAVAAASDPLQQLRAVEAYFQQGYFSQGLEGQVPSRSGHSEGRLDDLLANEQMIGDDEQYAVAMALAVSQLGMPVRVVMGFTPAAAAGAVTVTGDDLHAWVEVPFTGLGWVAFHPTPAEDRTPSEIAPQPKQKPRVQVAQPPDAPQEPAELPPAPPVEEAQDGDEPLDLAWLWSLARIGGVSLAVLLLLMAPSLLLGALRLRRRRQRISAASPVDRVDGGWAELVDAATDVGHDFVPGATRREQGAVLDERAPEAQARALAVRADAVVFGGAEPTPDEVAGYWADVETARRRIAEAVPWHRRLRARLFPASAMRMLRWPWRRQGRRP